MDKFDRIQQLHRIFKTRRLPVSKRVLAEELESTSNIRVNTISPGIIRSPLQGKMGVEEADSLAGLHLLNRIGEPDEVAEAAYYLATSGFITGETINVAGGHTIGHAI